MKQNKVFIIGVTGGIGSGKSTVLDYLEANYGAKVIKADPIGNEVKLKGNRAYDPIVKLLGEDILGDDGEIVKPLMAEKIFNDEELLVKTNQIIHPCVMDVIKERIQEFSKDENTRLILVEAALLIQAGYLPILDGLWVVDSSQEVRIDRLIKTRGYSRQKCLDVISAQFTEDDYRVNVNQYINKSKRTDFDFRIFLNDGMVENLYAQLDESVEDLLDGKN